MTPERAAYHLVLLREGLEENYDRELDAALEEEDPLSPLTLELACCMSDLNGTISVLRNFLLSRAADEGKVFDLVMDDLKERYREKTMTPEQFARVVLDILIRCDNSCDAPWV